MKMITDKKEMSIMNMISQYNLSTNVNNMNNNNNNNNNNKLSLTAGALKIPPLV